MIMFTVSVCVCVCVCVCVSEEGRRGQGEYMAEGHLDDCSFRSQCDKATTMLREKDEELSMARRQHSDEVARLVAELRDLRGNYEQKIKEYEELMDIRIQLDQEIATYRALLQEEETR